MDLAIRKGTADTCTRQGEGRDIDELQALEGKDVKDLLLNVGSGGGAAAAPAGGAGAAAGGDAGAAEEAKEEKEEGMSIKSRTYLTLRTYN